MNNPLQPEDVKARIALLEEQTRVMEDEMRERISITYKSLTPANLLKSAFSNITADSGLKSSILNIALKLGLGMWVAACSGPLPEVLPKKWWERHCS